MSAIGASMIRYRFEADRKSEGYQWHAVESATAPAGSKDR